MLTNPAKDITPAELAVMRRVAGGEGSKRIADETGRSRYTVADHMKAVRHKLNAKTIAHAVAILLRRGDLA